MREPRRTSRAPAMKRILPRGFKINPPKRKSANLAPAAAPVSIPYPGAKRSDPATSAKASGRSPANQPASAGGGGNLSKGAPTY